MKALVTGGGGFLGRRIAEMLRARGDEVRVFARGDYPELRDAGIETVRGDLRNFEDIRAACDACDVVFHVAALAGVWGRSRDFWDVNVTGTLNVIAACRDRGIERCVYTSTPSVVFGEKELCGVDERQPYPDRYLAAYPRTKAVAEQAVLAANTPTLATVALRPHLIWGPGDPHLIPRVIDRARKGRLVQVGDGTNLVDITYIDNAAQAHIQAADALNLRAACAGNAYFISQGAPVGLWPWLRELLTALGHPVPTRTISYKMAYRLGAVLEWAYRLTFRRPEPPMTRFVAAQLATSHYFNIDAARRDFGYAPTVATRIGLARLVESYQESSAEALSVG